MLNLPFFDHRHGELAARLETTIASLIEPRAADAESEVDEAAREFMRAFAAHGLLDLLIPSASNAAAPPDLRSICLAREALARASGVADSVFAVHGLGSYPILTHGSAALKEKYLPRLAAGATIGAFALTEPAAGSDIAGIETTAVRDGNDYVLNGQKTYISNAGIAGCYVTFAVSGGEPADPAKRRPLIALVVDADTPGFAVTRRIPLMAPHPIGDLTFDQCRVPVAHRLGGESDGMRVALSTLDFFRTTVGAAACGIAARALAEAVAHATTRRQFGSVLSDFQATRLALADMHTELDAARLLVYRSAWTKDQGAERVTMVSSMAKLFATEAAQRSVDRAVQIHGALGVTRGVVVERLYREIRALRIYEGTSEIQRLVIARQMIDS